MNTCPCVVEYDWLDWTCGVTGVFGKDHTIIVDEKFGLAVLDAAFGAAVRAVGIKAAGVTVLTLDMRSLH